MLSLVYLIKLIFFSQTRFHLPGSKLKKDHANEIPFVMNVKMSGNSGVFPTFLNQVTNSHHKVKFDSARKAGIYKRMIITITALTFLFAFCFELPSFPIHFHKDGVVHVIYFENQNPDGKFKYYGSTFCEMPGINSILSAFRPQSANLYNQYIFSKIHLIDRYSRMHKCRDDLLTRAFNST